MFNQLDSMLMSKDFQETHSFDKEFYNIQSRSGADSMSPSSSDALSLDDNFHGNSLTKENPAPSDFNGSLQQKSSASITLEQQRRIAQEQLLLYQRMVEEEIRAKDTVPSLHNYQTFSMNNSSFQSKLFANQHFSNKQYSNKFGNQQFGIGISQLNTKQPPVMSGLIYQVQFKATSRFYIASPTTQNVQSINIGEFVIVEAERGQDLGVVTALLTTQEFTEKRKNMSGVTAENSRVRRIIRPATVQERQTLADKRKDEESILQYCCQLVMTVHGLPISVHEAEYQFDKKKLTIYYDSATRVDFRELVRDLYAACKVRIWMEKINLKEEMNRNALIALSSGVKI